MRKYSFLQAVPGSFHSADLYRDVARHWRGAAFGYLLALQAVVLVSTGVKMHTGWVQYMDNQGVAIVAQMPRVVIEKGRAVVDAPQPYRITDPESGKAIAILDTTGEITSLDDQDAHLLLTRDRVFVKKDRRETRVYELSNIDGFELDRARLEGWRKVARGGLVVLTYPFLVIGLYVWRIIQILCYGLLGMLFAPWLQARLDYPALVCLAAVALTPALCAGLLLEILGVSLPGQGLLMLGLALFFLWRAILANSDTQQAGAASAPPT